MQVFKFPMNVAQKREGKKTTLLLLVHDKRRLLETLYHVKNSMKYDNRLY